MDEIEYKLNTKNSVLVINAIDKLIFTVKSKFKPADRQKFVLENEELKFLREKCSSKDAIVSLTACQGLLALVELGVLEIAHTMSTVVTLLASAHNYSAIISTMAGLLVLDLKSRLQPDQPYKCQFSLKSPQHPFITVLEKNQGAEDDVFAQMQALCMHTDYIVQSNSLELLRPVFLYLTCNPQREGSIRPWQLLLSLPRTDAQCSLLLACLSCQQYGNSSMLKKSLAAYSAVTDAAIFQRDDEYIAALMPMLARISNQLVAHCCDPRPCYRLLERCVSHGGEGLRPSAGLTLYILATNLTRDSALSLQDTLHLCLTILNKYNCPSLSVNTLAAHTLQWLQQPSYLTEEALKIASKIIETYLNYQDTNTLNIPNLKTNKIFNYLRNTDNKLIIAIKLHSVFERLTDNPEKLSMWLDDVQFIDDTVKLELLPFLYGLLLDRKAVESIVLKVLSIIVRLVDVDKSLAVELMPVLLFLVTNDKRPAVKLQCLKSLPLMAKAKENVPQIVSILNKLKSNKAVPTSFLMLLFALLAETQVRCFPYLQELLVNPGVRPDDLKWEIDVARISAIKKICELRASSHGLELVPLISSTLNRCGDRQGSAPAALSLRCIALLWKRGALAPAPAWRALQPRLERDTRPQVQISLCKLLAEIPGLCSNSPEFHQLSRAAAARVWRLLAEGNPEVVEQAGIALAKYTTDMYTLKDIPEIYRKTVKLPASYCKTPADAARNPEDVLDYIPCEVWPEVFKYTNQAGLEGVVQLLRHVIEREVIGYRSGVYHLEGGREPEGWGHLPPASAVRGMLDWLRKQIISPSPDINEAVTLSVLKTVSSEYTKPLPPSELSFVPELCYRGGAWKVGGISLAARMAKVSPSAKIIIENWMQGIQSGNAQESDIILFYELLPTLTKYLPPNTLRGPLDRSLHDAFATIANVKAKLPYEDTLIIHPYNTPILPKTAEKDHKKGTDIASEVILEDKKELNSISGQKSEEIDYLFVKQLELIKKCLDGDNIHDANRTLLSQLIEHYYALISDDNVAWPTFVCACSALSSKYLERMTSPTSWWEVTAPLLRKAGAVRGALAGGEGGDGGQGGEGGESPLCWLNDMIDVHAQQILEQEFSLSYIFGAAVRAGAGIHSRDWFMQLLARTQAAFKETDDASSKRYLYRVVCVVCAGLSGVWCVEGRSGGRGGGRGSDLLPAALPALLDREHWGECTLQVLEWLWHTRDSIGGDSAQCCQRALLALKYTQPFANHKIWTRLESYFGKDIVQVC